MYLFAVVLAVLWLFGEIYSFKFGGIIHVFLIAAIIVAALKFKSDRKRTTLANQKPRSRQVIRDLGVQKTWQLK
ncbi:MAG: lmo0937 family membrane protein [Limisphaerales bacterium]